MIVACRIALIPVAWSWKPGYVEGTGALPESMSAVSTMPPDAGVNVMS